MKKYIEDTIAIIIVLAAVYTLLIAGHVIS